MSAFHVAVSVLSVINSTLFLVASFGEPPESIPDVVVDSTRFYLGVSAIISLINLGMLIGS